LGILVDDIMIGKGIAFFMMSSADLTIVFLFESTRVFSRSEQLLSSIETKL